MPGLDAGAVFLAALAIALATGLGAIPLLVGRVSGRQALGIANAAAAGVMLGASASLVVEGVDRSASRTALGRARGRGVYRPRVPSASRTSRAGVRVVARRRRREALLIVVVMTVHSVAEGVGVGAAFGGGQTLGILIAVAIAVHNIPRGSQSVSFSSRGARPYPSRRAGASSRASLSPFSPSRRSSSLTHSKASFLLRSAFSGRDGLDGRARTHPGSARTRDAPTGRSDRGGLVRVDAGLPGDSSLSVPIHPGLHPATNGRPSIEGVASKA
jgi:hypothetical protein